MAVFPISFFMRIGYMQFSGNGEFHFQKGREREPKWLMRAPEAAVEVTTKQQ